MQIHINIIIEIEEMESNPRSALIILYIFIYYIDYLHIFKFLINV